MCVEGAGDVEAFPAILANVQRHYIERSCLWGSTFVFVKADILYLDCHGLDGVHLSSRARLKKIYPGNYEKATFYNRGSNH